MIIDCHTHLNTYHERQGPTTRSLERLLNTMRRFHIDHSIVLTSYEVSENRPRIEQVLELCTPHPNLSVVEGVIMGDRKPRDLRGMRRRLEQGRTIGLKMYPGYLPFYPQDAACVPVYDLAQEFDVPVLFHTGDTLARGARLKYSHPLHIDDVAVDHPSMRIVLCHLGNPWFRDAAEVMYKNPNVSADISGLVLGDFEGAMERWIAQEISELLVYVGEAEQLLYGTDWPLVSMAPYLKFVRTLSLEPKAAELLLWRNAVRIFHLEKVLRASRQAASTRAGVRPELEGT